jgi:structural maintenance of chromosomes protein 5
VYSDAKKESMAKLEASKAKLDSVDDELRDTFKEMEEVIGELYPFVRNADGLLQSGKAHERDSVEIQDELATQRQKLEMVLNTNPGVVDQYERRQHEVRWDKLSRGRLFADLPWTRLRG